MCPQSQTMPLIMVTSLLHTVHKGPGTCSSMTFYKWRLSVCWDIKEHCRGMGLWGKTKRVNSLKNFTKNWKESKSFAFQWCENHAWIFLHQLAEKNGNSSSKAGRPIKVWSACFWKKKIENTEDRLACLKTRRACAISPKRTGGLACTVLSHSAIAGTSCGSVPAAPDSRAGDRLARLGDDLLRRFPSPSVRALVVKPCLANLSTPGNVT